MGKYILSICMLCVLAISCSDDDNLPNIRPSASGEWTDDRDENSYEWIRVGEQEWMTSNLKYGTPYNENEYGGVLLDGSGYTRRVRIREVGYDFKGDIERHGNLYSWEEAIEVCPEGWRLPTDGDWKSLEKALGMSTKEVDKSEAWRGDHVATLLRQGEEGLGMGLQLSGNAGLAGAPTYLYLSKIKEFGYYWTATEEEDNNLENRTVYYRKIFATYSTIYRGTTIEDKLMRVRCVRDVVK